MWKIKLLIAQLGFAAAMLSW